MPSTTTLTNTSHFSLISQDFSIPFVSIHKSCKNIKVIFTANYRNKRNQRTQLCCCIKLRPEVLSMVGKLLTVFP
jgi:hypothetical protein